MGQKREIFWYLFTNDSYTNEVISRELPPENTHDGLLCFDGVERKLWSCDGTFITKIKRNEKTQNFRFEIFKREGKYGKIKKCDFFKKKKKKVKPM